MEQLSEERKLRMYVSQQLFAQLSQTFAVMVYGLGFLDKTRLQETDP